MKWIFLTPSVILAKNASMVESDSQFFPRRRLKSPASHDSLEDLVLVRKIRYFPGGIWIASCETARNSLATFLRSTSETNQVRWLRARLELGSSEVDWNLTSRLFFSRRFSLAAAFLANRFDSSTVITADDDCQPMLRWLLQHVLFLKTLDEACWISRHAVLQFS